MKNQRNYCTKIEMLINYTGGMSSEMRSDWNLKRKECYQEKKKEKAIKSKI